MAEKKEVEEVKQTVVEEKKEQVEKTADIPKHSFYRG
jgi:hypothetical protein